MKKGVNPHFKIEKALRTWLRNHHGVIGYSEALGLGATRSIIVSKVTRGEWERLHRGVYRDTATPRGPYQLLRAGCVATAGLGVVSHGSAAWVWGLLDRPPVTPELTVPIGAHHGRVRGDLPVHQQPVA